MYHVTLNFEEASVVKSRQSVPHGAILLYSEAVVRFLPRDAMPAGYVCPSQAGIPKRLNIGPIRVDHAQRF